MTCKVVFSVKGGALPARSYVFFGRTHCRIGRSSDCELQVPSPEVSRHHCVLDVQPPYVHIRDLGSRSGTFVNGIGIGRRDIRLEPALVPEDAMPAIELHAGDEVRVGMTVFDVAVVYQDEPDSSVCRRELVTS
jgi:eukaryotic-like serine/threonine-protein kinase